MSQKRNAVIGLLVLLFMALVPATSLAQSAITGQVKDATGAVLPGVTVEVSSPALIEKVRSASTDGQGVYRIVDLRPGIYKLTFSLAGFGTTVRDEVELPASFTATVNAELKIGSVEETVIVSGQSPIVDVSNVAQQTVMDKNQIDFMPAARISTALSALLPGVQTLGFADPVGRQQLTFSIHNSRPAEQLTTIDGFSNRMALGVGGSTSTFYNNQATVQETTVTTSGASAEQAFSGIWTNIIPKEGGNSLSGQIFTAFANSSFASSNLNDTLRSRGIQSVTGLKSLYDFNAAMGGRIVRDTLWFYAGYRQSAVAQYRAGIYYNLTPTGWAYTPDLTKPSWIEAQDDDYNLRLTWQVSPKNKVNLYYDRQPHVITHRNFDSVTAPEATNYTPYQPNYFTQAVWKSPATSRLLLEAGIGGTSNDYDSRLQTGQDPDVSVVPGTVSVLESSTGLRFRAPAADTSDQSPAHHINNQATIRASASYVTGSHSFKTGVQLLQGSTVNRFNGYSGDLQYTFLSGAPRSITEAAVPAITGGRINRELGIFGQDQWDWRRLTLNLGVRYDNQNNSVDAVDLPAGRWVPARSFPAVSNAPNWNDISPRLGVAWDVFGTGRDAAKVMLNRYVAGQGTSGITTAMNPVSRAVLTVTRTWTDVNQNFVPDCDLTNPLLNGECAQISDLNFGQTINPRANQYDPALLSGWGVRGYNWETSATYQHEFTPRISAMAGYFRRAYGNFTVTDNVDVTPADYDPYCITAPPDPRLPGGGGNLLCGYYNVKPALFGHVDNFVKLATETVGKQTEIYNGFDVNVAVRGSGGSQISGGMSIGQTVTTNCQGVDSPQQALFCQVKPPYLANIKASGTYLTPWWGIRLSGSVQNVPGAPISATYTAKNAEIAPSLGRSLAAGVNGTANVPLFQPGVSFEKRQTEVDIRFTKGFSFGRTRLLANLDIFNALNLAGIDAVNTTYGPSWLTPTRIQGPRYAKISAQVDF